MINRKSIFRELVQGILKRHLIKKTLFLDFAGYHLKVSSNSPRLIEILKGYYRGFVCAAQDDAVIGMAIESTPPDFGLEYTIRQPDPGKTKIKEEYIDFIDGRLVRKRLTGMEFLFDKEINLAIGPCIKNYNQVINFINNRYIQWRLNQGCILLHASAVQINGQGIAMCGFSGMGKSTMALHLMSKGATFVSNDRLMVQSGGEDLKMFGVAKLPRINPGTILNNEDLSPMISERERKKFSALSLKDLWNLECKYDADIHKLFGENRFIMGSPMMALIILNWKRGAGPIKIQKVNLKKRKDLWQAFMKDAGLFFQATIHNYFLDYATPQAYIDHLRLCSVYEITGNVDFKKASQECWDMFKKNDRKLIKGTEQVLQNV